MELDLPQGDRHHQAEADFKGKTLGVWFFGNEYPFFAWMNKLGIKTDGGADGVTVLKQSFDVQPLLQKQADCISVMTYNEYWQLIDAGFKPEDLIVFKYEDQGVATAGGRPLCARGQAQGSGLRGQDGALRARLDEGLEVRRSSIPTRRRGSSSTTTRPAPRPKYHQKRMMKEIAKLTAGSNGALDDADYQRTVKTLLAGGSDPVISKEPTGAFTHEITDKALK